MLYEIKWLLLIHPNYRKFLCDFIIQSIWLISYQTEENDF